jgi:hypothetical protein
MVIDIGRWLASTWEQVLGCDSLKEHFHDILRSALDGDLTGVNTAVFGASRSGKTSIIKLFVRCLLCQQLDPVTLNPCNGGCKLCCQEVSRFGLHGIFAEIAFADGRKNPVHYVPIDCTSITEQGLRDKLIDLRDYDGLRVVYLDEAHRLARRIMDEQLLKPVEERRGYMWILSAATTGDLERMFLNRFVKFQTTPPSCEELAIWTGERCKEFEIEWDDEDTILRLVDRANFLPGLVLQVLGRAQKRRVKPQLSRNLVEGHLFTVEG